jgi:hypothetical protein
MAAIYGQVQAFIDRHALFGKRRGGGTWRRATPCSDCRRHQSMLGVALVGRVAPIALIGRKNSVAWKRTSPPVSLMAEMGGGRTGCFTAAKPGERTSQADLDRQ